MIQLATIAAVFLASLGAAFLSSETKGMAQLACDLPLSMAGEEVDLAGTSQAPCVLTGKLQTTQRVLWIIKFKFGSSIPTVKKPAKDMFAYLAKGETAFPVDKVEYCATQMSAFVRNNKQMLIDTAKQQNKETFLVFCNQRAQV